MTAESGMNNDGMDGDATTRKRVKSSVLNAYQISYVDMESNPKCYGWGVLSEYLLTLLYLIHRCEQAAGDEYLSELQTILAKLQTVPKLLEELRSSGTIVFETRTTHRYTPTKNTLYVDPYKYLALVQNPTNRKSWVEVQKRARAHLFKRGKAGVGDDKVYKKLSK